MIRLLLVDDHPIVREGLAAVLSDQPDFEVVGMAGTLVEAATMTRDLRPDVLLLDLELPDGNGADLLPVLLADHPALAVLIFTAYSDDERLRTALRAGAKGYLLKGAGAERIARAIRIVHSGGLFLEPDAAATVLGQSGATRRTAATNAEELTDREREVLRLVVAGLPNKQIAATLGITERTAKFHLSSLMRKLGASSRAQVAALAVQRNLV
jgi:DNA-binding NarL/FixJ family response regulator